VTDPLTFSVPGRPVPTARARVTRYGTFTPTRTENAQTAVAHAALVATGGKRPLYATEALSVSIMACFAWPKGTAKKRILKGWTPRVGTPDLDNLAKTVLDGCNGVVYRDDAQIVELTISKWRVEDPGDEGFHIEIEVRDDN